MSDREIAKLLEETTRRWAEKRREEKERRENRGRERRKIRNLEAFLLVLKWLAVGTLVGLMVLLAAMASGGEQRGSRGARWEEWEVTSYAHGCIMPKSGKESQVANLTASGKVARADWTVAGPPHLPFGTRVELAYRGIVALREVQDRGRAIQGRRLDLFLRDCRAARSWGRQRVWVRILGRRAGGISGKAD